MALLSSCNTLETRNSKNTHRAPTHPTPPPTNMGGDIEVRTNTPSNALEPVNPTVSYPPTATPPPQPTIALPAAPKSNIKVGVIVGPGGMKTFAALGVFREMNRARIPVFSIVGLEWGSVMGGLYASQGQINDAEWKAFKLKEDNLPESGFLQSKASAAPISKLNSFLDAAFTGLFVEKSRIDFACSTTSNGSEKTGFMNRGSMKSAMEKCVPYPPMHQTGGGSAEPFAVEDAANWLRSRGANVVLLIDVLGQGEFLPGKSAGDASSENLLWQEIRREMYRAKAPYINHVIHVNTSGHPVTDFDGRRALMDAGSKAATDVCNKMVSQYGF